MKLSSPTFITTSFSLVFTFACSDPPTPPAQGALLESIQSNGSSTGCAASAAEFTAPGNTDPSTGTHASLFCDVTAGTGCKPNSNIVVDGDNGASVSCTVAGGGPFQVDGSIAIGDIIFTVSGTLDGAGGKAFLSSSHTSFHLQDPECAITIEPNSGQIKPGAIWATFDCKKFGDTSIAQEPGCEATGKFLFENCSK